MSMSKGRYWRTDEDGNLLNDASPEYIQPPFAAVVQAAVDAYLQHIPDDVHSIYVTGSIPRGLAIEGESDLDMFAVLTESSDPLLVMQDWIEPTEEALIDQYPCVTDVQLEVWPDGYVFTDPARFSIGAFIIKTHSVCVWGSDLTPELGDYPVSAAIANDDLVQIEPDIAEAVERIQADRQPANVRYWCRRVMKQILRAGFALVMVEEGRHTRDHDLCYEAFARHYPGHAADMKRALEYARFPLEDADGVLAFLENMGSWIIAQANRWLDEHNPARDPALAVDDVEEIE
ncbi:MAG: hypothetical protein K8L99_20415 [Anaerolineae bacterium]|nr:hypothetical protein [Anaerolineae bacterium]